MTTSRARRKSSDTMAVVAPLLWTLLAGVTVLWISLAWSHGAVDFSLFLESSRRWRAGTDPYAALLANERGINLNPPGLLVLLAPLTMIGANSAFAIWFAALLAGLFSSLKLSARVDASAVVPAAFLSVATLTGGIALQLGQLTFLLMPLVTLGWLAYRQHNDRFAGCIVGALIYLKPFFGVYLLFWAWRRNWRALLSGVLALVIAWTVTFAWAPALSLRWVEATSGVVWQAHVLNGSIPGVAARLFSTRLIDQPPTFTPFAVSRPLEILTIVGLSIALLWASARRARSISRDGEWTLVGIVALLLSPLGWTYYLPLLAPSLAVVIPGALLIVPLIVLNIPGSWIAAMTFGPTGTLLAGSGAFWVFGYLWFATTRNAPTRGEAA